MEVISKALTVGPRQANLALESETTEHIPGYTSHTATYIEVRAAPIFFLKDTHTVVLSGQLIQAGGSKRQPLTAVYSYALTPVGTGSAVVH